MTLPAGLRTRPLTLADVDATVAMVNACELHDSGEPMWERADLLADAGEIWLDKLAVDRRYRHRGVARALLQTAFRRSFDRGYLYTSLSTDSNTGALTLYERIGMTVHRSFTHHVLDL